ncbi:MAG: hypothetical protein Kow00108_00730 [Calditrichia bacterium]
MKSLLFPISIVGVILGLIFLFFYLFNRGYRLVKFLQREEAPHLGFFRSIRNLIFILLWNSFFGMLFFASFYLIAFQSFTWEKPVADVYVEPTDKPRVSKVTLTVFENGDTSLVQQYLINGDYWMVEGDILKWTYKANLLGLNTRFRLIRIRGRFEDIEMEKAATPTIYNLSGRDASFFWKNMYKLYRQFPLVRAVYGNAVFQSNLFRMRYKIYVTQSGFIAVPIDNGY